MNKVMSVAPSTLDDLTDDTDGNDNNDTEMEELLKTVKGNTIYYLEVFLSHNIFWMYLIHYRRIFVFRTHPRSFEATSRVEQN